MRVSSRFLAPLLAVGLLAASSGAAKADVKEGDHFVELDIAKDAKGKNFKLKALAGKWVLFTFGAKWCEPCHKELPAWDKLATKYTGKILFVAVNINNDPAEGKAFLDSLKLKHMFPVFLPDEKSAAMKSYNPDKMPSTFVIDPKGIVRVVHYGYNKGDEDDFAKQLDAALGG